jgi:5'-nucleotidase
MHFIITNDDGLDAPGLAALARLAASFGTCTVVAPDREYSACGHQATSRGSIDVREEGDRRYRVFGTPVDCVRLAVTTLAIDADLVLSGINPGGNLGVDIYTSGTVGAAREAVLLGCPAIAFSHYLRRGVPPDWDLAVQRLRPVVETLLHRGDPRGFWNVNLPHPPHDEPELPIVPCEPDDRPLDIRYIRAGNLYHCAGNYDERPRTPGRDVDVCFSGRIALSHVHVREH